MDWVRESSWARAARRLARNASARSSTSAIRRCSASGGSGTNFSSSPQMMRWLSDAHRAGQMVHIAIRRNVEIENRNQTSSVWRTM